jgi:hypothetical protein
MVILGYTFSERWSATMGYEYIPVGTPGTQHYVNVGGNYHDGPFQAKAFVGKTSGGSLCSGGVCLPVPAYTGAYVETIYTF